ncbi:hypothetical protein [Aquibacillus rhizosphaerae]|uniref:Glycogen biosynthesis protein GlgD n=1 Tax=Aquibacillus rhizosphaerae TaxID=3051431 RepID=A0ABT7LA11_9BACI|nr:hypothetical protein [Aquibacillus sp. LR5S19]MDL4842714.1 hypothetical protein [Aquibacillus sp. LR5S19]
MDNKKEPKFKKSYESDGVMGTDKKNNKQRQTEEKNKDDNPMFFNITESSE